MCRYQDILISPPPDTGDGLVVCGYSGHGDTETLAQSGYPVTRCPHSCPRHANEARPGPGAAARCTNIPFNLHSADASHRIAACCTTNRIILLGFTQSERGRLRFQEHNTSNDIFRSFPRVAEVGPRAGAEQTVGNEEQFRVLSD